VTIFHLLNKGNKLKLPEVRHRDVVGHTNDSNYCLFYRMVQHSTSKCFILKDKIQALIDIGILKLEQKKVIANEMILNFRTFSKMTILDGLTLIPKVRLEVINPLAKE